MIKQSQPLPASIPSIAWISEVDKARSVRDVAIRQLQAFYGLGSLAVLSSAVLLIVEFCLYC